MLVPAARRLAVATAALAVLAASMAAPASAKPLTRFQNTVDDFSCVFATQEGPTVFFYGDASSAGSGSAAFVEGEDLYLEGWEGTAVFGNGTLTAAVELKQDGVPFGDLAVSAASELGTPRVEKVQERVGNKWTRGTITTSDYTFSNVVVSIDGFTPIIEDTSCAGQRTVFDLVGNDPAVHVYGDSAWISEPCAIAGMADAELLLSGQPRKPYLEVVIGAQGTDPAKAQGQLERSGSAWRASLPLIALATEEQVDTLGATVTFTRTGKTTRERTSEDGFTEAVWRTPYRVSYRLVTTAGTVLTAQCQATRVRTLTKVKTH